MVGAAPFLAAVALAALPPWVHPWPIGAARRYHPPAAPAAVRAGRPIGELRCSTRPGRFAVHVELFASRRVAILPAGIGRGPRCTYPASTTDPAGVVRVRGTRVTLGDLFRVWGQPLGPHRVLSFRSGRRTLVFVGGRRRRGDPRTLQLRAGAEIVIEIGGFVPPHPSYLFPKELGVTR